MTPTYANHSVGSIQLCSSKTIYVLSLQAEGLPFREIDVCAEIGRPFRFACLLKTGVDFRKLFRGDVLRRVTALAPIMRIDEVFHLGSPLPL